MAEKQIPEEKKKIDFSYNLSVYWGFLKKYKLLFLSVLATTLIVEALNVADRYLFKVIIDDGTEFVNGIIAQSAFIQTLIIIAVIFISLVVSRSFLKWLNIHLVVHLNANLIYDLKQKYFNHIVGLSHRFHITHKTGSLISRMTRGSGSIEGLTDVIAFQFAPLIFQLIIVGFSLAVFDKISAVVLLITVVIFISYSYMIQRLQTPSKLEHVNSEDIEKANIGDIFTNIDSIKYYGKEKYIEQKFSRLSGETKRRALKNDFYFRWFDSGQILILGVGVFFLIYFPLVNFLHGGISLGTLVFIYTIYGNVVGPMFGFVWGLRHFYRVMADLQDLFEYGKAENEIKDKLNAKDLKIKRGKIEFRHVTFGYSKGRKIIDNINITAMPGQKIALVGHSGSGKTTLVKLLYRFYDLKYGKILIDRENIKDVRQESLRSELSVVPQEAVLFDDTIYNNILFSNPNAKHEEVMNAIKFAHLDKFIENLPDKEKTIVGERGVKLSGGEKQRVSIARAILANKKILVLDEATSSLDSKTENEIQRDLKNLMKGRTSVIIAHRLSTIMHADKIVVMDKGKIVQVGKHSALISKPGTYKELWELQKGGYIEE